MHDPEDRAILGFHPTGQHVFEFFGIDLLEQATKGPFRGHVILLRTAPPRTAAPATALAVIEALGKLGDGMNSFATGHDRQGEQGQTTGQAVAHPSGIPGIGQTLLKALPQ